MPRDVTRRMLRVLQSESFSPIELLEIRFAGSTDASTLRLTNAGEQLTFGGNTYYPVTFARAEVREILSTESGEQPSITITVGNVNRNVAEILNSAELEGAAATLYLHDRALLLSEPTRTRDAIRITTGEVRAPVLSNEVLVFQIINVLTMLGESVVPRRLYQSGCNATFGSASCGADLSASPNTIDAVVLTGSTRNLIRVASSVLAEAGNPSDLGEFWINGYVTMRDGPAATQSRPIHAVRDDGDAIFYLAAPLLATPEAGDELLIRRGCGKTKRHCVERQGNALNFQGFEELPGATIRPIIHCGYKDEVGSC